MRKDQIGKLLTKRNQAQGCARTLKGLLEEFPDRYIHEDIEQLEEIEEALVRRINRAIRSEG